MAGSTILHGIAPSTLVFGTATLLIGVWILQTLYEGLTSPLRKVPGPWYSRFTNQVLKYAVNSGRRIFYLDDLHHKYGPIVRISPTEVAVSDVEAFKQIHAVTSKFKKDVWYAKLTAFPRLTVFTMREPKPHTARRKLYARGFSKTYLRDNWESVVKAKCRLAVEKIKADAQMGRVADTMKWWTFMATDIVGHLGFGESFGLLELGRKTEYIRVLEAGIIGNGIGAELPWLRAILSRVPYKPIQEAFNSTNYVLSYAQKAVDNARALGKESNLMAAVLNEAAKEKDSILDDMDVQSEATGLIFAGSGTTANTMTYLIWSVLSRPELHKALEAEVAPLSDGFNDAELEELPLLNATIMETLRLYCAVPGSLPRVAPPGGATLGSYYIPEGTTCSTQAWTLHRDSQSWERPHDFDPSRHLPDVEWTKSAKTTFCAFGAGAYTCLGMHLAWMELRAASTFFFRECKGAKLGPRANDDMIPENYFVINPKGHRCEITLSD